MRGKYKPKSRNLQQKVRGTGFLIIFARKSTPNAMKPETVCTVVFSPTGTSKKIAETVARSIASDAGTEAAALKTIDLTHAAAHSAALSAGAVAVIAAPVYGGHVAPTAAKRLETLRGSGTPAVVIAVYGNRAFEKAAAELAALAARQGFVPVAAAAFVGEHSYSTPETPVAAGRPDAQDLARAAEFGAAVRKKLAAGTPAPVDAAKLKDVHTPLVPMLRFIRFVVGYRRRQKKNPVVYLPACDADRWHPLRPLRRDLPDAGHRAGRRGAHRPCALYPLLRLRQGMSGRSTEFPHPLRRSPRTQLHPAQTTRNDLIIRVERLASPAAHELDALTDLWERSVRATHDFLAPEDIPFFRRMVRQEALPAAEIYVIRDSGNGFAAFAGIGADRLEMLFVAPSARGKGLGRELVEHVAVHCGVRRVDVNEQNAQAAGFYARMGFRIVSRDALDPSGRPYPILHLER